MQLVGATQLSLEKCRRQLPLELQVKATGAGAGAGAYVCSAYHVVSACIAAHTSKTREGGGWLSTSLDVYSTAQPRPYPDRPGTGDSEGPVDANADSGFQSQSRVSVSSLGLRIPHHTWHPTTASSLAAVYTSAYPSLVRTSSSATSKLASQSSPCLASPPPAQISSSSPTSIRTSIYTLSCICICISIKTPALASRQLPDRPPSAQWV